jgi:hypothetical protein
MIPFPFGALKIKTALAILSAVSLTVIALDPTIKVALIAAGPPTLLSLVTLYVAIQNRKQGQELHISLNSRLSQLLQSTGEAAHAAGRREGVESTDKK